MHTPKSEFVAGLRMTLPLLAGVAPFGLIYGVLASKAGIPPAAAIAMSIIAFGGSAQIIATKQYALAVPAPVMVLTTFVVNLRHILYSASMGAYLRPLARPWKWLLAYLLTDEAYAISTVRYQQPDDGAYKHWFFLGTGVTLWSMWQITTIVGVLVGQKLDERWALDFTLALTFIGLLAPVLVDRAVLAAAVAAGLTVVAAAGLPLQLGLIVAAAVGIAAGMLVEGLTKTPPPAETAPGGGEQ